MAPLAGLVLAGGRSARMGEDKAGLVYADLPHALRVYRMLEDVCHRVFVSDRHEQSDAPGHYEMPHIFDLYNDIGPLNGILSAFAAYPDCAWLVVACDLPSLDASTLDRLVRGRDPAREATAFRNPHDQLPEPLCAIYEPAISMRLMKAYRSGRLSPREALRDADTCLLEVQDAEALHDANDPESRARALARLRRDATER
jgi:molybdopterin-guanine dinucleotide biosynthesis protein A